MVLVLEMMMSLYHKLTKLKVTQREGRGLD